MHAFVENYRYAAATDSSIAAGPAARLRAFVARLSTAEPLLTGTGLFMAALLLPLAVGVVADPREITGAPAWLKPAKFAASTAIYSLTLAWIFSYLPGWTRTRRLVGRVTALTFLLEVAIIGWQAWRGTTSHFNIGTPLDTTLFAVMGTAIVIQTIASAAVAVALWRQRFADRALGWALRLGMVITIIGASTGGLMTRPTSDQLAEARATGRMAIAGAHTVGGPDGGPGLPVTGWSRRHGDLRVPHFIGLHAVQLLPMVPLITLRRKGETARIRLTVAAGAAYAVVFVALLIQALQGMPLVPLG
jgi:hypothetical protein